MNDFLFSLWFFLPAGVANVAPIFAAKWKLLESLAKPLDLGCTFRGKRLVGDHKTFRGLLVGICTGVVTTFMQVFWYKESSFIQDFSSIDYSIINPFLLGFLLSLGAIGADAIKSFIKRQIGLGSGATWFPFDQLDYILGGILVSAIYIRLTIDQYILITILWFLIHIISTITGYLLRLKSTPL